MSTISTVGTTPSTGTTGTSGTSGTSTTGTTDTTDPTTGQNLSGPPQVVQPINAGGLVQSSIGPVSGINYGNLISGLIGADEQPIQDIQNQINTVYAQNNAFLGLSALLTQLKLSATNFNASGVFNSAQANTSNPNVINAVAGVGTPNGSYQFTVQRLASSSNLISQGFADAQNTPIGTAGNIDVQFGKGQLSTPLSLSQLNGGKGVQAGSIRITDRTGATSVVDLSQAVDVNDVVNAINSASGINVQASISDDKLVITDNSGGTAQNFTITNVGGDTTAADLGIAASSITNVITGTDINQINANTSLNSLNDGNGVRTASLLSDFVIHSSAGDLSISLTGDQSVGDVLKTINTAGNVNGTQVVTAAISADGHGITITDSGGGTPTITQTNSDAAADLGLLTAAAGGAITGSRINAGLTSPLLSDLNGGSGVNLGTIHIVDRTGKGTDVILGGSQTVADVLAAINSAAKTAGVGITAGLNNASTGIQLSDTTSGTGNLTVTDVSGTSAANLGIAQNVAASSINGGNAHLRYVSFNTPLSTLNGGGANAFQPGTFSITDSTGKSFTVNVTSQQDTTVGSIINAINQSNTAIRASIDPNGNGILLTDTGGGTITPNVQEISGNTAASLNLLGNFTNGQLDGTQEKQIAILATDTLQDVANKINDANLGLNANIINDGSGSTPFRLSITSVNAGAAGNVVFDGSALGINTSTLVQGQDAVVRYGGSGATGQSLTVTSSSNTVTGVIPGLTLDLQSTSNQPVNVSVTQDTSQIETAIQNFVTNYNAVQTNIGQLTSFDPNNPQNAGILFANSTIQQVQDGLGHFLTQTFTGVGQITSLASLGISVQQDGTLQLDTQQLQTELQNDPTDVQKLFTTTTNGVGDQLSTIINQYIDPQTGTIFQASDDLQTQQQQLVDRATLLNSLLTDKKNQLVNEFANLEVTIAQLQQQGSALSSYKAPTASSSSSSS